MNVPWWKKVPCWFGRHKWYSIPDCLVCRRCGYNHPSDPVMRVAKAVSDHYGGTGEVHINRGGKGE